MSPAADRCEWAQSVAAYLLRALDDDEARVFETHLDDCERCHTEIARLHPAIDALGTATPQLQPPAELRDRIMGQVRAEAELFRAAAGADADRPPRRGPRPGRGFTPSLRLSPAWAAAASAMLIAVGGIGGYLLHREGSGTPADSVRVVQAQVARSLAPDARAELVIRNGAGILRLRGMPQPPPGQVYQLWLKRPGTIAPEPTNALFGVRADGTATVAVPKHGGEVREVLVTAEPRGGSRQPTSPPILAARLA